MRLRSPVRVHDCPPNWTKSITFTLRVTLDLKCAPDTIPLRKNPIQPKMTDSKTAGAESLVAIGQVSMDSGKLGAYLDRISQAYPELGANKAEIVMEGQNNDVLIVNNSHVFRFPRHQEATDRLETECAILNWIRPYITSVQVPAPLFSNLSPLVG